jgi:starch-binding outer membrane protein, SusD/RagB family
MKYEIINKAILPVLLLSALMAGSCNKILDEKSNQALAVPHSITDFQAVLDNSVKMNDQSASWDEAAADNFYLPEELFKDLSPQSQDAYVWKPFNYYGNRNDWASLYDAVYLSNLSLEGISQITADQTNLSDWNNVKGSALFFRAQSFLHTAFIFCEAFDSVTAANDYGIVLRLSSDFNQKSKRATLKATYDQIINDLKEAIQLLPLYPVITYRPSKPAAYALLARTYLSMRNYIEAGKYADSCLKVKNDLIDYNSLDLTSLTPFEQLNKEVIFQRIISTYMIPAIAPVDVRVDTTLYQSYAENDLRKQAFYFPLDPGYVFIGTYNGNISSLFTGIATDEVYLMRAECLARQGFIQPAMNDLNTLLVTRFENGTFKEFTASNKEGALKIILAERRKELPFRCLRWMDIKRLNKEGANIVLQRIVGGKSYELLPGDSRYALPLPADIIKLTGIPQNKY